MQTTLPPGSLRAKRGMKDMDAKTLGTPVTPASVLVHGSVFLDVVMSGLTHLPVPGQEQWVDACALMPGGSANQAVAAARLGLPVSLCAYLGTDQAGGLVRDALTDEGVNLSLCADTPQQNVTVSLALGKERAMTTVGTDTVPALPAEASAPAALVAELSRVRENISTVRAWREAAGQPHALVVSDVGWDPTERWLPSDLDALEAVDVFTPNVGEATAYTRTDTASQAAARLAERVPLAVVTCGPDGVIADDGSHQIHLPATPVVPTDTTGAGDSFSAGLVWALLNGLGLRAALSAASLTASATLDRPGGSANAPTLKDLAAHARELDLPAGYDLSFLDLVV